MAVDVRFQRLTWLDFCSLWELANHANSSEWRRSVELARLQREKEERERRAEAQAD